MQLIDTHVHLYGEEFLPDLSQVLTKAIDNGITHMIMPNVDKHSIDRMNEIAGQNPGVCLPMIGLHPCYVKEDFSIQLEDMKAELESGKYCGIGEIGLDLYWDKTFYEEQKSAFRTQLTWAREKKLPVAIHSRNATREAIDLVKTFAGEDLTGIFHCFNGTREEAEEIIELGFYLGIGGVVTFKNGGVDKILQSLPIEKLVLETDGPYLAPVPFRGKRNESSYLTYVAKKVGELYNMPVNEVSQITSENARRLFNLK